jgi:hypothetical protein
VVSGYLAITEKSELTYDMLHAQTVKEDGTSFHIDEHSPTDTLKDVAFETVQTGLDLFQNALNRINSHTKKYQYVVRKSLVPSPEECATPSEVDLTDLSRLTKRLVVQRGDEGKCTSIVVVTFNAFSALLIL